MIGPVPTSKNSSFSSQFTCATTNEYIFCAPNPSGDYYIAIPQNQASQNDAVRIRNWFGNQSATPYPVPHSPPGLEELSNNFRIYNVTAFMPSIVVIRNGTRDDVVGPNCYQSALVAAGYADLSGRHVAPDEFEYYLKRDYIPVWCGKIHAGAIIVYDSYPMTYDAGDHAAYHLLGGLVFQKGGWERYYPYEITTLEGAMPSIGSHWRPAPEDRFGNPTWPGENLNWQHLCYERRLEPLERATSSTLKDREWFLPLLEYYTKRLERISQFTWSDFKKNRIDLLTIENMWKITRDFSDRVGNFSPMEVLLKIDDDIVETYLKLDSLSWQYQAMVDLYYPIKTPWHREELYQNHYVNFNDDFYEELKLYLRLYKVPEDEWGEIINKIVAEIKTYDPAELSHFNGTIPYFDILESAINSYSIAFLGVPECAAPDELSQY